MSSPGVVYLLHFDRSFGHAKHYMGWASDLAGRLRHHEQGSGANLLRHVRAAGIGWVVARTWEGDRSLERRMKCRGHARRCPICRQEKRASILTNVATASTLDPLSHPTEEMA